MGKFKKLQMSDVWEQEMKKYPRGYTIIENLIDWLSQTNKLIDNVNDWNVYLDDFVENFDKRLEPHTIETLYKMADDGTLDRIINENIFNELNGEIEQVKEDMFDLSVETEETINQFKTETQGEINEFKEEVNTNISNVDSKLTQQIADYQEETGEKIEVISGYVTFPQSPKPEKMGDKGNGYKIIHKRTNDTLYVTQPTNKGYVQYRLEKNRGANGQTDYGQNHESLRLVRVRHMPEAYVYYGVDSPVVGSVTPSTAPSGLNSVEERLINTRFIDTSKNHTSRLEGIGSYIIEGNSEVIYRLRSMYKQKANVLLQVTEGSSQNVDILVNDYVAYENVNLADFLPTGSQNRGMIKLELPIVAHAVESNRMDIKIINHDSRPVYICAINFNFLKDYDGTEIDQYKVFGSTKEGWIETGGASDYAIRNTDNILIGSYHGGERAVRQHIWFNNVTHYPNDQYSVINHEFDNIGADSQNAWSVQDSFHTNQRTILADGVADMIMRMNFDTNGTIDMDFSYHSHQGYPIKSFRTALTCTGVNFRHVIYPIYHVFGDTPSGENFDFDSVEGMVSQVSTIDNLQIDIRFTKFNRMNAERDCFIADVPSYAKFYYGPLDNSHVVGLKHLNFSKSLDFIVR